MMKRFISVILSVIMVFSAVSVAFAQENEKINVDGFTDVPVVLLSGDSTPIVNKDGEQALQYKNFLSDAYRQEVFGILKEGFVDLIYPYMVDGLLTNNWQPLYDTLYEAIGKLFEETLLDKNGDVPTDPENPAYMSTLDPYYFQRNDNSVSRTYGEGYQYSVSTFWFFYDWRLDTFDTAAKLHEYIQEVKRATGHDKVGLIGRCLGTSVVMTYVKVYGMDDLVGVAINGSVVNGAEVISEPVSGKFNIDMDAVVRFLEDSNGVGLFNIDNIVIELLDMIAKSGVYDIGNTVVRATIYQKLVEGVTSALARSTFFTWPTYWTGVAAADYQNALNYVFGPEGSELRTEYAGLIEKLDRYDREVRQQLPAIYDTIDKEGNLGIMSKYEFQIAPIVASCDKIGDQFASVEYTSVGATTSSVYETLEYAYVASQIANGKGRYISPDRKIDASTCLYPDYTWFVKGSSHSHWSFVENALLQEVVTAPEQIAVNDTVYSQFMVYDYDTDTMEAMNKDNCGVTFFTANKKEDEPDNWYDRINAFCDSFAKFMNSFIDFIMEKIKSNA